MQQNPSGGNPAAFAGSLQSLVHPTPQGGQAIVFAYPMEGDAQFFMAFFTRFRRIFLQNLLLEHAAKARLLMGPDGTRVYRSKTRIGTFIAIMNPTLDTLQNVRLRFNATETLTPDWAQLSPDGKWETIETQSDAGILEIGASIPPLEGLFLLNRK